ncbi:M1 family peptidase [Ornithobacterium rhinotracheale]|nr:M1 family peptidase [Ornithobacterium rhinotracheale]
MRKKILLCLLGLNFVATQAQNDSISLAEKYLRGKNNHFRDFWDVKYYDLQLETHAESKSIKGEVIIDLSLDKQGRFLQIDLQKPMQITKVEQLLAFNKVKKIPLHSILNKGDHYFIPTKKLKQEKNIKLRFSFQGKPKIALQAPWDGGWIFTEDLENRNWLSVAVQHQGASLWFPCKDYQGDEPDRGAMIRVKTENNQVAVANGNLISKEKGVYTWQVKNPINTYNITPNIGNYVHFSDTYHGENGKLKLNYWVLDYNVEKAKKQFKQVPMMLKAFEHWFGAYPFYEDSYKLVETPFLGMEHQSNIAYGNDYQNGYRGMDRSGSGYGNLFDFIIIHESGHEWFGNNITTEQIADMWVHEAFTTYSEALFVEYYYGKEAAQKYLQGYQRQILNDRPMQGVYDAHQEGSVDMYNKGACMIQTLREWMNDDAAFLALMRGLNKDFRHKIVTGAQIERYISDKTKLDLKAFFNQYLRTTQIPILFIKKEQNQYFYRWENCVDGFAMPIQLENKDWIHPTQEWKVLPKKDVDVLPNKNLLIQFKNHNS